MTELLTFLTHAGDEIAVGGVRVAGRLGGVRLRSRLGVRLRFGMRPRCFGIQVCGRPHKRLG